jgi:DNA (cytosine-5)-methyltransferase 1
MGDNTKTFYEFFAGGGMARAGLGEQWSCLFANDFDPVKTSTYIANWGDRDFVGGDVAEVLPASIRGQADLAWASFPCQDLSLAGSYVGLGRAKDNLKTRSGAFWLFWSKMQSLGIENRYPRTIVLENVYGTLTSRGGKDFAAIGEVLSEAGYRFGAVVVDARRFTPQSRPRVFIICIRKDLWVPAELIEGGPLQEWHPRALVVAHAAMSLLARKDWIWWKLGIPPKREVSFADIVEEEPTSVQWHTQEETAYILSLMSNVNRAKVTEAKNAVSGTDKRIVGGIYRRTRPDENGVKRQRAEVRFDDIAGCLRTPSGGSSRQTIIVVESSRIRTRLLSPREAARLMGLPDTYLLPLRYNDAYHVCGDGVVAPVVRHLAANLLEPILAANPGEASIAAE